MNLWVSNTATVASPGNNCDRPGYSTIGAALAAATAGSTINVCAGTYTEQLTITTPVDLRVASSPGSVTVVLPATPVNSTTSCDTAPGTGSYQPNQDAVAICTSGTVGITGLNFQPSWPSGTCDDSLYGILVAGNASLEARNVSINGGGAQPINGCQGGVAIQVGMAWTTPVEVGHAVLQNDTIAGYQKNGITIDGSGSTAAITNTTVSGAGETPVTAQNGIQVSNGAVGTITNSTISGNECDAPSCGANGLSDYQAAGVLFYGAAPKSSVSNSSLTGNDIGVYYASSSPTAPTESEVAINNDQFSANRYESVALDQGSASLSNDTITGPSAVGIALFQYSGQSYGVNSTADNMRISGMSVAAVDVVSDLATGDQPGEFSISHSAISDNAQSVLNPSSSFTVTLAKERKDH